MLYMTKIHCRREKTW